jgi:hypothetical protein
MSKFFDFGGQIYRLEGEVEPGQVDLHLVHTVTGRRVVGDLWEAVEVTAEHAAKWAALYKHERRTPLPKSLFREGLPNKK